MNIIIKITDTSRTLAQPGAVTVAKVGGSIELTTDDAKIIVPASDLKKAIQALELAD